MQNKKALSKEYYRHEKFGIIPKGWDVVRLGDYFDFFPTASYSRSLLTYAGECLYIHYGDLHTKFERFIDASKDELPFITEEMAKKYTSITEGDLIISDASEDYEGVGKAVEVINVGDKTIISGLHTLHLRTKNNEFVNGFKGYVLNESRVRNSILRCATGIKVYSVSKTELKKIYLPKPPVEEQKAIATILSKVDEAIKATENTIKATKKLKKSLIQNLLTGKLKSDGTWRTADEFYQDEKFGNVPVRWVVKSIGDDSHCNINPNYKFIKGKPYDFIPMEAVNDSFGGVGSFPEKRIIDGGGYTRYKKGDILFAKITPCAENGKVALIKDCDTEVGFASTEFIVFSPKESIDNLFFYYLISSSSVHMLAVSLMEGTTGRQRVPWKVFKNRIFASFPTDVNEQKAIAALISKVENLNHKRVEKIDRLKRLKKALMQKLLTGKVRVNLDKMDKFLQEKTK